MKFFIQTWGCQMNDHDSEKLSGLLLQAGYTQAEDLKDAGIVLLNTCSIREKAVQKVYSVLGRLREIKKERPLIVGVVGCLAQQEQEALFRQAPHLDLVLGTMALQQLPRLIEEAKAGKKRVIDAMEYPDNHLFPAEVTQRRNKAKALVTIMEGCNHHCTYCVVPQTRGPERSRSVQDILGEVHLLVERGFKEIELLGQNVNSYEGGCSFAELLNYVSDVSGVEWIRFTTSHPMNFTKELAQTLVTNPKITPFLHLPVQSGSNRILKLMGRGYTREDYLERLGYLGEGRNRFSISTDIIVGFPGETDADFEDTLDILEQVQYDASFSFLYSPRPKTAALKLPDDIPTFVKSERLKRLQQRQTEITLARHQDMLHRDVDVRIESLEPTEEGHWMARTARWQNVHLQAPEGIELPFGQCVRARITHAGPHFLGAELV